MEDIVPPQTIETLIPVFEKRILENPKDFEAYIGLGLLSLQLRQFEFAEELLKQAAEINPKDPRPRYFLGFSLEHQENLVQAEKEYREALLLDRNYDAAANSLLGVLKRQNKYGEIIKLVDDLRGIKLNEVELYSLVRETVNNLLDSITAERYQLRIPILVAGHGHAAGGYVAVQLMKSLNLMYWQEPLDLGTPYNAFFYTPLLDRFVKLGGVIHTHVNSSPFNTRTLEVSGIGRFLVIVREPRQALYSMTVWNEEVRRRTTDPGISHYELPMLEFYLGKNYFSLSDSEKLDFMIETELPCLVRWIEGWLDTCEGPILKGKVIRFEDFKTNPDAFYKSILDFYEIPHSLFKLADIPCAPKANGRTGAFGMRKGALAEWREHTSKAQTEKMNSMIPAALMKRLGYEY